MNEPNLYHRIANKWRTLKTLGGYYLGDLRFEDVPCPLCRAQESQPLQKGSHVRIPVHLRRCNDCSLVFQSPRLTRESNDRFYRHYYRPRPPGEAHAQNMFDRGIRRGREFLEFLRTPPQSLKNKRVLEIGCAYGGILQAFVNEGARGEGWDTDPVAVAFGKRQGLDLHVGEGPQPKQKFDFLILSHVLEHIPEPSTFLDQLKQQLTADGRLLIEVPHYGLKNTRAIQLGHLLYFTEATLKQLLAKTELHLVDIQSNAQVVRAVAKSR